MHIDDLITALQSIRDERRNLPVEIRMMASDGVVWKGNLTGKYLRLDSIEKPTCLVIDAAMYDKEISINAKKGAQNDYC